MSYGHTRASLVTVAAVVAVLGATTVGADEPTAPTASPTEAATRKTEGDRAMESLRYADALTAYEAAYRLEPRPELLYNQGRALQALARFPEALAQIEAFARDASPELQARVPTLQRLLDELRGRTTEVAVDSTVRGARILVDDVLVGETPLSGPIRLSSGRARLEVTAEGYFPFRRTLVLPGGGSIAIVAALVSRATSGVLVVRSPVAGATVLVDGRTVGKVPAEANVRAGPHRVVVRRDGYEESETTAMIKAGERKELSVALAEPTPVTERWWFWTGVGVVVLGGTAVTIALLTEGEADRGNIPPGRLPVPLVSF